MDGRYLTAATFKADIGMPLIKTPSRQSPPRLREDPMQVNA
jgi:hypothetical protein